MTIATAWLVTLAVIWLPGALLARLAGWRSGDPVSRFAMELALGISFWPVLFLFTSTAGLRWSAGSARVVVVLLAAGLVVSWFRARPRAMRRPDALGLAGAVVIAIVAWTRVRHIDGIAFPLWVDSVHHTMIVRLLEAQGRLPADYAPYIPDSTFYYHWGYHALIAFVAWIGGVTHPEAVPRLLLVSGQLLNALTFFAVHAGAKALFVSRRAALLAATLATLVSVFPAYYVSWGRYTQLCGLLLLPPAAVAAWRLTRRPSKGMFAVVAILTAGLLLVHVRVAVLFAILMAVLAVVAVAGRRTRGLLWCGGAIAAAMLLVSPWLLHLARTAEVRTIAAPRPVDARWETSNEAPRDLLWAPRNDVLFAMATGGLLGLTPVRDLSPMVRAGAVAWWLWLIVLLQRTARRRRMSRDGWKIAVVAMWVLAVAAATNLGLFGLHRVRLLTNGSAIISLFLPASIVAAYFLVASVDALVRLRWRRGVAIAGTLLIALVGARGMTHIVNPDTILVTEADLAALRWIRSHTPTGARFAVMVQPWIGGSFIGTDGGYWIPLVAERQSILPPGLYPWVMPRAKADAIESSLSRWSDAARRGDPRVIEELRAEGVTHLYFGPQSLPAIRMLRGSDRAMETVYEAGGVGIVALR